MCRVLSATCLSGAGVAQWWRDGLVMKRSPVRVPAGGAGELSSLGFTCRAQQVLISSNLVHISNLCFVWFLLHIFCTCVGNFFA